MGDVEDEVEDEVKPLTNGVKEEKKGLPYTAEQWAPHNPSGKKQYERDFLMQLQTSELALRKPEAMPTNMQIVRDEVDKDNLRHVASAPNLGDFTPFVTGRPSTQRTPNRRDSRQGGKSAAATRLANPGVKIINLDRAEVIKEEETPSKGKVKEIVENLEQLEVAEIKEIRKSERRIFPARRLAACFPATSSTSTSVSSTPSALG